MSKLNKGEKTLRKDLKEDLNDEGGIIFSDKVSRVCCVVVPCVQGGNATHGRVSVSLCSAKDTYNRKRGELEALVHWSNGESIPMRFSDLKLPLDGDSIMQRVLDLVV